MLAPLVEFLAAPGAASSAERRWHDGRPRARGRGHRRHRRRRGVRRRARRDADRAPCARACRTRASSASPGRGWRRRAARPGHPLETLSVRGFVEVLAHLPRARRASAARSRGACVAARVPLFIGVDAPDFNLGLERKLKRRGVRTIHFVSPSVWAWRRERVAHDRPLRRPDARAVPVRAAALRGAPASRSPSSAIRSPRDAADADSRREAREQLQAAARAAGVRAAARQPRVRARDARRRSCSTRPRASSQARPDARFLVPLATRATRDAFEARDLSRSALDTLPLTLLYGHATDALHAADVGTRRVGHRDARGGARALPARDLLSRVAVDRAHRRAAGCCCRTSGCRTCSPDASSCPSSCRTTRRPSNLAQAALNLFDDTVTRRRLEALFAGIRARRSRADTGALAARGGDAASCAARGRARC